MNSFIKLMIAYLAGDSSEAKAIRIQRRAAAILKCEIAATESQILKDEEAVISAEEALHFQTLNQGNAEINEDIYIRALIEAHNAQVKVKNQLKENQKKLEFLKDRLAFVEGKEEK